MKNTDTKVTTSFIFHSVTIINNNYNYRKFLFLDNFESIIYNEINRTSRNYNPEFLL